MAHRQQIKRGIAIAVSALALIGGAVFPGISTQAFADEPEANVEVSAEALAAQPRRNWRDRVGRAHSRDRGLPSEQRLGRIRNRQARSAAVKYRRAVKKLASATSEAEANAASRVIVEATETLHNVGSGFDPNCFGKCQAHFNICVAGGVLTVDECRLDQGTCQLGCLGN